MWKMIFYLFIGCISGYSYIKLMNFAFSSSFTENVVQLILHPVRFFVAIFVFLIGVVMIANYIQKLFRFSRKGMQKKREWNFMCSYGCTGLIFLSIFLLYLDWVHGLIFLSFSFIYGIISLDA
jgi:hypothetical protein